MTNAAQDHKERTWRAEVATFAPGFRHKARSRGSQASLQMLMLEKSLLRASCRSRLSAYSVIALE